MRNLPGSEPAQPQGFQGQGSWLRCLPRGSSSTLPDCMFRWGLQQRLGCNAPGAGRQRAQPGCSATLDPFGVHAASCNWGQVCKRHDRLRDLIAQAARQAGMAAVAEQNMTTAADTPGAVRGIHRADVRIVENDGRQPWVDVKVISTKPKVAIKNALCQAEVAKCKQYGQGPAERSVLHGKMIPCAAKVAERKKQKIIHFFNSKFQNCACSMCQLRVQWAGIASNRKRRL